MADSQNQVVCNHVALPFPCRALSQVLGCQPLRPNVLAALAEKPALVQRYQMAWSAPGLNRQRIQAFEQACRHSLC